GHRRPRYTGWLGPPDDRNPATHHGREEPRDLGGDGVAARAARRVSDGVPERLHCFGVQSRRRGAAPIPVGAQPMSHTLRSVELFLVRLPLIRPFTTSSHTKDHLDHILVRVRDAEGNAGWGECASAADPYYCSETTESSWHMLRDFLIPHVLDVA